MKASRYIIIRKQKEAARKACRPFALLKGIGLTISGILLFLLTALGIRYAFFSQSFPSLDSFRERYAVRPEPTQFYARDEETLLFTLAYENFESRDLLICEEDGEGCIPRTFLEAARISREEGIRQGQMTSVTEEMVRKVYREDISSSRFPSFTARLLSDQVTRTFGEDQILAWYYNSAWFGQMAFGLDAAARLYLDKPGEALNDAECVLLSAIINSPMLNPIDSHGAVRDSYLQQIALLHRGGLFSDEESEILARTNFTIFEPPQYTGGTIPDIITRKALDAAILYYGREQVERGGLKIITSEDAALQNYLNCITSPGTEEEKALCPLSSSFSEEELQEASDALLTAPVSIAVLDTEGGQLLAALEAPARSDQQEERVFLPSLQAYPIGTAMNVFAALTAFSGGSAPSTLLWDLETSYESEAAEAIGGEYRGPIRLREALTNDHQRPLIAHMRTFGTGAIQQNAALFGLSNSHMLSEDELLTVGGSFTAETLAFSLIPFAASGEQTGTDAGGSIHPVSILRVEMNGEGARYPQSSARKTLIAANLAYLVHDVFSRDTGNFSLPDRPAAVKIGKISGEESLWISGYTRRISSAIRLGNAQTVSAFVTDTDRVTGTAAVLWRSVMEFAHRGIPASGWDVPADISQVRICLPSGKLPTSACEETVTEVFLKGNEPYEYDEYYVEVPINKENRMLATRFTPPENITYEVFLDLPEAASEWAADSGIESLPTEYDPIRKRSTSGNVRIESPAEFQTFSTAENEKVDIIVRLSLSRKPESLQVSIGSGMYPTQWTEVYSGGPLENGKWLLCSLNAEDLEPGLYVLRTAFTLPGQVCDSAETYFEIL